MSFDATAGGSLILGVFIGIGYCLYSVIMHCTALKHKNQTRNNVLWNLYLRFIRPLPRKVLFYSLVSVALSHRRVLIKHIVKTQRKNIIFSVVDQE